MELFKMNPMYGQRDYKTGEIVLTRYAYHDTKHAASLIYSDNENQTKTTLAYNSKKLKL